MKSKMPKVLNKRTDKIPPDAIYVGRPSIWGNPLTIHEVMVLRKVTKEEAHKIATEWYRRYLEEDFKQHGGNSLIELAKKRLKGKDLVCWCAPLPCHADILLELANKENE